MDISGFGGFREAPRAQYSTQTAYNGGSVMVWGDISVNGRIELVTVPGIVKSRRNTDDILRPHFRQKRPNAVFKPIIQDPTVLTSFMTF